IGHQSTAFIELNRSQESMILIEMHPTHFQLMRVKENKFKIFNCFAYENIEDLLYYITYALRQLKIEKEANVELSGWIQTTDSIFTRIKAYLPNIKIRTALPHPIQLGCIPASEAHIFNQVIRQHQCA
ncbi:MAG: DUF3822 family protein, partial [Flavobacteriales bacterium]|nr:DUF3822 family protein [Flavobacteriales bacterium]